MLIEILKFMLAKSFLEELFKPQNMHPYSGTKTLFTKLAHSSVMKLNENSMSKLFDLMVMGVKWQIIQTVTPEEVYHVTITHLDEIQKIVQGTQGEEFVNAARDYFTAMCKNFTGYDYMIIKQQLLSFFQDRHIKVSLFIQEQIQGLDGTLFIGYTDIGPVFSRQPGPITYFSKGK